MRLTTQCAGVLCAIGALIAAGACSDSAGPAGPAAKLHIVNGDRQEGTGPIELPQPLVVVVLDAGDRPVAGAEVTWIADDGGSIAPPVSTTDSRGRATARWTLGPSTGEHHARAVVGGGLVAAFTAIESEIAIDQIIPLTLTTYDGSGQVVHPDVAGVPMEWNGDALRLAITPYPGGDASFENPSLFTAPDAITWRVPDGLRNPVESPTTGYLSDPDVVFDPDSRRLWMYYRQVTGTNDIELATSADGVHWDAPQLVVSGPNHTVVSPSVVRRAAGDWWMWAVNGGSGCTAPSATIEVRRSTDGIHWGAPVTASLSQPGYYPWHVDVEWIPSRGEFWAVYNVKTAGSCTTPALYLATSADGVTWTTYPAPVLARGAIAEFANVVYRSTFAYDPTSDVVTFWYSGAAYTGSGWVWRAAEQRRRRADLFAQLATAGFLLPPAAGSPPPELTDGP